MGSFECNSIEDLSFNRSFRSWVLDKNSADASFWEQWVSQHPHKAGLINHSKAIIYALQINFKDLSDAEIDGEIEKILQKQKSQVLHAEDPFTVIKHRRIHPAFFFGSIAAAVLIIGSFLFLKKPAVKNQYPQYSNNYESFISQKQVDRVDKFNSSEKEEQLVLPDGSKVQLGKKSSISYVDNFSENKREVYLTGEAFFEITKNASRPFLVYTHSVITKVLGTSFRIRAYSSDPKAIVTVKTGKVSVFKADDFSDSYAKGSELGGILLTANQEVIYDHLNNQLNKTLTEKPVLLAEQVNEKRTFVFDATPVSRVFKVMHDAYGIPIMYDEEIMAGCSLSATLGDESFYDKLKLICKAINASYEIVDGNIVITSNGCK